MKKTLLAAAIPALMFANGASAVELYNDGVNSVSMGGHLTVELSDKNGDTQLGANSPRINFSFNRDLGDGFKLDSRIEMGMSNFVTSGESFSTRLGYIGVGHDDYGRLSAGKQWSVYYDVTAATDMPIAWGSDSLFSYANGTDGGKLGLGRADQSVQYRNGVSLGNAGDLNFGVQWQGANGDYDDRLSASVTYGIAGVKLGYAYSGGDVDYTVASGQGVQDANVHAFSAAYGTYGKGLYLAGAYAMSENLQQTKLAGNNIIAEEADGYEALAAYGLNNGLNLYVLYQGVEDTTNDLTVQEYTNFGAEYKLTPNTVVYGAYKFDHGSDIKDTDDGFAVGLRIFL
ncbi:porin [Ferrimonas balearica]|uniref:porin n=1 Tax=Ferrimonas balearica TaxID=44012 RepID=UPI001C59958E|nr:porin [Ferrimonas balearica]MBW3164167.1 porin [Ferrimonas balearica]MBY6018367.1 porin [Halomonas denitrificans]MBY6094717.1 porin [Ferrimonas balearica]MBY6225192.1 porin [Ferrimonas balearica]